MATAAATAMASSVRSGGFLSFAVMVATATGVGYVLNSVGKIGSRSDGKAVRKSVKGVDNFPKSGNKAGRYPSKQLRIDRSMKRSLTENRKAALPLKIGYRTAMLDRTWLLHEENETPDTTTRDYKGKETCHDDTSSPPLIRPPERIRAINPHPLP